MSDLTKKAIAFAFKELLLEKPMNKITVSDITTKCGINRQTFYYHFTDLPDMVEWICFEDADNALKNNKTYATWQEGFLSIFRLIKNDEPFILNIYRNVKIEILENYLYKLVYPLLLNVVKEKAKDYNFTIRDEDLEFIANFYKYSFVGIVLDWIKKGLRDDPVKIVERVSDLTHGTIDHALNNCKH